VLAARGRCRPLLLLGGVAVLVAWSVAEAALLWDSVVDAGYPEPPAPVLLAAVLPLPLLLAPRAPVIAALLVIAVVLFRGAVDARAPNATIDTLMLAVALFAAEAGARHGPPLRGAVLAGLLVGGTVMLDSADRGYYALIGQQQYIGLAAIVAGGVGAGYALRDRRREAKRLQREVAALDAQGPARIDTLLDAERRRIAAELEDAVALLLHSVRPLAERAARATAPAALAADMRTVQRAARAAMTEMRRALHLLRGAVPDAQGVDLATAVAASRRTHLRHALGWAAPVALLAALGIADHRMVPSLPAYIPFYRGGFTVDAPALGDVSPYFSAVLCTLPLLARGRAPVAAALAVFALLIARMLLGDLSTLNFNQYYVAAAAAFLCAAHARSVVAGAFVGAAGAATAVGCLALEQSDYLGVTYAFGVLLPGSAAAAGLLVRERVITAAGARRAQEDIDRRHEAMARERVVAERLQAARELHDVVGHAVTIIGLQAAAAVTLSGTDVERARAAAGTVVQVTGDAERDLARLSAVLGAVAAEPSPPTPPPSLRELVERMRAAGLPVALDERVDGEAVPLPLTLAAFRIVQEALTNVRRHAGALPTRVTVTQEVGTLVVEVVNDGPAPAPPRPDGRGLVGMRERAELYGGRLSAGPGPEGGWHVRAELPFEADPPSGAIAGPWAQRPLET
jgi:signal transduction histidine kinase